MRVLFIAFDSGELSVRLASALVEEVDEVCLMLPEDQAISHLKWLNPALDFQPFQKPRLRQPLQQVRTLNRLIKQIRAFDPDIIHYQKAHHLWFNLALPLLRQYPLVITIHDPKDHVGDKLTHKTPQFVKDFAYRRADRVITHNEPMKQIIMQRLRIPPQMIEIVPLLERGDASIKTGVTEEGNQVLFFGRIFAYKGLEYLIRAEPLITSQVPSVKIVIAGRGDDLGPYRRLMVNPDNFIIHNEFVSNEKRARLFHQASVVALPYVEATQSGVIPVAYTHKKAVVATAVGGLPSQVEHGHTGLLVPPCDERALAEAIIYLLQNGELRCRLGENGRRKLEREWSSETVARQTLCVYERVLRESK